ncbi:MAG: hypothetical protein OD816_000304 [Thermodesulfobacterium sp.]|uniref:Uncharacterized protein n=1 Tax=Candidatus Thermodesulfobacterium syntrophicum TaxID=3060442 RepID=A0AAE3P597_9BACT|nr:hypothetical protein [Candidatus Thermodesulfobacterium syntrophicum]
MIKTMLATEYPTRYVAFKYPKTLILQKNIQYFGGFEYAIYYYPVKNKTYPHLTDGLYAEMVSYQGKKYLVDITLTLPNEKRSSLDIVSFLMIMKQLYKCLKQK